MKYNRYPDKVIHTFQITNKPVKKKEIWDRL